MSRDAYVARLDCYAAVLQVLIVHMYVYRIPLRTNI